MKKGEMDGEPMLNLSLLQERLIKSKDSNKNDAIKVITFTPFLIPRNENPLVINQIINSAIVESVLSYIEQITDSRTVQALEYYVNDCGTSLTKLCEEPEKVSKALHGIFGDGANFIIDQIIIVVYTTLGLKCCENVQKGNHNHGSLAESLVTLRRLVREAKS